MVHVGVIGLGTIGSNLAKNLAAKHHSVYAYNRSSHNTFKLCKDLPSIEYFTNPAILLEAMPIDKPRVLLTCVPHGHAFEDFFCLVVDSVREGDIFIDCANEHHATSQRRGSMLKEIGVQYIGAGVSGGANGALNGPCVMIGGTFDGYQACIELFNSMCNNSKNGYFGTDYGIGHFVKMVHNGIEDAMLQAVSELYAYFGTDDMHQCFHSMSTEHPCHGYISELTKNVLEHVDIDSMKIQGAVNSTRLWCTQYAAEHMLAIPTIASSATARIMSKDRLFMKFKPQNTSGCSPSLILQTLSFVYACILLEGKMLCDHYGVDYALARTVWSKGSIIACNALHCNHEELMHANSSSARLYVENALQKGVPCSTISTAIQWYDTMCTEKLPMNLVIAQQNHISQPTIEPPQKVCEA